MSADITPPAQDSAEEPPRPRDEPKERAPRREIFGWAMFDFANQAYTLLIITVIFGDLFTRVIVGDEGTGYRLGNLLWSVALSVSYAMVALVAPLLGAVTDYSATRKRCLFASYLLTAIATSLLYFAAPGLIVLAMVLLVVSNFGYALGESLIASFLPDLGPSKDLGGISGFGWALGYVGGLVSAGLALFLLGEVSLENFHRVRWVGPFAGVFFLLAAIPTFVWLKERGARRRLPSGLSHLAVGLHRIKATLQAVRRLKDLSLLLVSIFFLMAGVYIVIAFAFIYGAQIIGWDEGVRNYMFVVVQITAAAGALGFGVLQDRLGARLVYLLTLALWILAIAAIYFTPELAQLLNVRFGLAWEPQHVFLAVGCLAGTCLGSSQSAGRALVGILAPAGKSAEVFGFWGLSAKLAAIFGLLGVGAMQALLGLRASILLCILLFMAAMAAGLFVQPERGQLAARARF